MILASAPAMGEVLAWIMGVAAIGAAAFALIKDNGRKGLIITLQQLLEAQKEATRQEREGREHQENVCHQQIAELRGQVEAMQSTWIKSVAQGVAIAVREHLSADD